MISSLLPGLREFRAAFAAGALWLVGCWFAFGEVLANPSTATGALKQFYRLVELAGRPITVSAVAFVAYVIGVLSLAATRLFVKLLNRLSRLPGGHLLDAETYTGGPQRRILTEFVVDRLSQRLITDDTFRNSLAEQRAALKGGFQEAQTSEDIAKLAVSDYIARRSILNDVLDLDSYAAEIRSDRNSLRRQAAVMAPEVYQLVDRYHAEADFRFGLVLPVAFISIVLAVTSHPAWLLGLLVSVTLSLLGESAERDGSILLFAAFASGKIGSARTDDLLNGSPRLRKPLPPPNGMPIQ